MVLKAFLYHPKKAPIEVPLDEVESYMKRGWFDTDANFGGVKDENEEASLTKAELLSRAEALGLKFNSRSSKAEILAGLEKASVIDEPSD